MYACKFVHQLIFPLTTFNMYILMYVCMLKVYVCMYIHTCVRALRDSHWRSNLVVLLLRWFHTSMDHLYF